eukprot:gene31222-6372_t
MFADKDVFTSNDQLQVGQGLVPLARTSFRSAKALFLLPGPASGRPRPCSSCQDQLQDQLQVGQGTQLEVALLCIYSSFRSAKALFLLPGPASGQPRHSVRSGTLVHLLQLQDQLQVGQGLVPLARTSFRSAKALFLLPGPASGRPRPCSSCQDQLQVGQGTQLEVALLCIYSSFRSAKALFLLPGPASGRPRHSVRSGTLVHLLQLQDQLQVGQGTQLEVALLCIYSSFRSAKALFLLPGPASGQPRHSVRSGTLVHLLQLQVGQGLVPLARTIFRSAKALFLLPGPASGRPRPCSSCQDQLQVGQGLVPLARTSFRSAKALFLLPGPASGRPRHSVRSGTLVHLLQLQVGQVLVPLARTSFRSAKALS